MSSPTDDVGPSTEDVAVSTDRPDPYVSTAADFLLLLGTALVVAVAVGAFFLHP